MISRIQALNYRCLKYIDQPLGPFHILVGPNASGKTTFLDVVGFLGRLVSDGLEAAVEERTSNFQDLVWGRSGTSFELAVEAKIPERGAEKPGGREYTVIRYEVSIQLDVAADEVSIQAENVILLTGGGTTLAKPSAVFPHFPKSPRTITQLRDARELYPFVARSADGSTMVAGESGMESGHWFKVGLRKSALAMVPEDELLFPMSTWLKGLLSEGVQKLILNSALMRNASPPGQSRRFRPDGSNLPWVVQNLQQKAPDQFQDWIRHVQTAVPDLEDIRVVDRPEDRHRYLMIRYQGGLEVPSWTVSDGTLRLLALTVIAYIPDLQGIYLIEEPENGMHPQAIETAFQSLSSVYEGQVLMATHSPIVVSMAEPDKVLCFARTPEGATDIVRGNEHPKLKDWDGRPDFSVLFGAGMLE